MFMYTYTYVYIYTYKHVYKYEIVPLLGFMTIPLMLPERFKCKSNIT